jgi:predicted amino acid racemase
MAFINLSKSKLQHNYTFLNELFGSRNISWAVVSKLLCGNKMYLEYLVSLGPEEICDSRISNLKLVKQLSADVQTIYIKPPAKRSIQSIVRYADVSFNTEFTTMQWLSEEAVRQNKIHKVIIMIELGDLREGVMGEQLMDFYGSVFNLPNIKITGIGTNLNCLHGVMPSQDKLIQLSLYKQLIETKFNQKIPWVTGGTSVMIPLIFRHQIPAGINQFRVGESLYFGIDLFENKVIEGMNEDVFTLYAEIIEMSEKPKIPIGTLDMNPSGEIFDVNENDFGKSSFRAIIDIGLLDINPNYLMAQSPGITIAGASSDMLILDLEDNPHNYKTGDLIAFKLKYMGALSILNSNYIEKRLVE